MNMNWKSAPVTAFFVLSMSVLNACQTHDNGTPPPPAAQQGAALPPNPQSVSEVTVHYVFRDPGLDRDHSTTILPLIANALNAQLAPSSMTVRLVRHEALHSNSIPYAAALANPDLHVLLAFTLESTPRVMFLRNSFMDYAMNTSLTPSDPTVAIDDPVARTNAEKVKIIVLRINGNPTDLQPLSLVDVRSDWSNFIFDLQITPASPRTLHEGSTTNASIERLARIIGETVPPTEP